MAKAKGNTIDDITLPRSIFTEVAWRNGNLARLIIRLLNQIVNNGEVSICISAIARDLGLSRQTVRTLINRCEVNQLLATLLTKSLTTQSTKSLTTQKVDCKRDKPLCQPNHLPPNQPNHLPSNQPICNHAEVVVPDYISPTFVAPEFAEIWHRFIEYRKEIKKPYKSAASEKTAYNKMVEMANNNPATAKDMVERTILGQWQGLYPSDNGKRNKQTAKVNAPLSDAEKLADYEDLANEISKRINSRKG